MPKPVLLVIFGVFGILGVLSTAYAYSETPPFPLSNYAESYGIFRYYEGCWWRVNDVNAYVCVDGSAASSQGSSDTRFRQGDGGQGSDRSDSGNRSSESIWDRVRARHGSSSSTGGDTSGGSILDRIRARRSSSSSSRASGESILDRIRATHGTGGSRQDEQDDSDNPFRFSGDDNDGVNRAESAFSGNDGFFASGQGTSMNSVFYQPLGLFSCDSIFDQQTGDVFGPVPCTSYPGVFGPVPHY